MHQIKSIPLPATVDHDFLMDVGTDDAFYLSSEEEFPGGKWARRLPVTWDQIPASIRPHMEEMVDVMAWVEGDDEDVEGEPGEDEDADIRVSMLKDAPGVYELSIHYSSPFNPSGNEFYFHEDGTFLGWTES